MKISMITDEMSADPETAIELATDWGIKEFELRGFYTDRAPELSPYQKQRLRDMLEDYEARVIALSPGLFKVAYPTGHCPRSSLGWMDRPGYEAWAEAKRIVLHHLHELLPASLEYANELGARLVVVFSFHRAGAPPGMPPDEVLDCLRRAAEQASAAGLQLAIETEEGFWADTGERSAQIVRTINHPALGINWDPANSFCAGDVPYPEGYSHLRGLVRHVHFKDATRDPGGEAQFALHGEIDWAGQIQALANDGYDGFISVETHLRPKVCTAKKSFERLRALVASATQARNDPD
jgi:sugar phosphate isomerase/epimerase